MKLRVSVSSRTPVSLGVCALLLGLSACSGGSGGAGSSTPPAAPVTQSTITLPSSVQVVTAN